jgi:ferredoxin
VRKWSVDGEKCFSYWGQIASDCMICIRVCPYNKDFSRFRHRIGRRLAATRLRGLMLWLEDRIGYGKRLRPRDWWAGRDGRPV